MDGINKGVTPYRAERLEARAYRLGLTKAMYHDLEETVLVEPGAGLTQRFELRPAFGTLVVEANVDGATVLLDGQKVGKTPLRRESVPLCRRTDCTGQPDGTECAEAQTRWPGTCAAGVCVVPGCGDASCNSRGPSFPVSGTRQFTRTTGTEPVVTDSLTGLVWQGCPAGLSGDACGSASAVQENWDEALAYCTELTWAGFTDWYLPDEYELQSIVDYGVDSYSAIDRVAFPATLGGHSWSSSSSVGAATDAWYVGFSYGTVLLLFKSNPDNVRCVRRGP